MSPGEAIARLPHAAGARMIDAVLEADGDRIRCAGSVPPGSAWIAGTDVPSFVAIEIAAQAAAVLGLLAAPPDATPAARGYVVRVRDVRCARASFPANARILVEVRRAGAAPPLALYRFEAATDDGALATGTVGTWIDGPDPEGGVRR